MKHRYVLAGGFIALAVLGASSARADAAPTGKAAPAPAPASPSEHAQAKRSTDHRGQFGLRPEIVAGYRMLFRYDDSPPCAPWKSTEAASGQQKFCGFPMAPALGLAFSYGVTSSFEPFLFLRIGLADERDHTQADRSIVTGLGTRLYTVADGPLKVFFTPSVALEHGSGPVDASDQRFAAYGSALAPNAYRTDLLVHFDVGPQYDLTRELGVYASAGLTTGVLRYLGATAEIAVGVSLRAP